MTIRKAKAKYTPQKLAEFQGNPLIEAIPPRLSQLDASLQLMREPDFSEEQRNWEPFERELCAKRLQRCVVPTIHYYQFYTLFHSMLVNGYLAKNPRSPETIEWLYDKNHSHRLNDKTTADTVMVTGISGLGKSTMIEHTLTLFPQVIEHTNHNGESFRGTQILFIKFSIPPDGERKGLFLSFFRAVDSIMKSGLEKQYGGRGVSVDAQRAGMDQICKTHWIGAIIIDELQNLNVASSGGKTKILQLFDEISNLTKVPIIKIGTNDSLELFRGKFTSSRRADSAGNIEIKRHTADDFDWNSMYEAAWNCQWTKKMTPSTPKIFDLIYQLTQGIPFCLFRLLELVKYRLLLL